MNCPYQKMILEKIYLKTKRKEKVKRNGSHTFSFTLVLVHSYITKCHDILREKDIDKDLTNYFIVLYKNNCKNQQEMTK